MVAHPPQWWRAGKRTRGTRPLPPPTGGEPLVGVATHPFFDRLLGGTSAAEDALAGAREMPIVLPVEMTRARACVDGGAPRLAAAFSSGRHSAAS